jgi:hypothetical protein
MAGTLLLFDQSGEECSGMFWNASSQNKLRFETPPFRAVEPTLGLKTRVSG